MSADGAGTERASAGTSWLDEPEVGSPLGIRATLWFLRLVGRGPVRAALPILVFYYFLLGRTVRRASRTYLARLGVESGLWASYRHVLRFAQCAVDRPFLLLGRNDLFEVEVTGHEHIERLVEAGKGGILLGAHLGSFEALRMHGRVHDVAINVLGHFGNAAKINAILSEVSPEHRAHLVDFDPDDPNFVFRLRDLVERGELIAILGDRVVHGKKTVPARFLGAEARFPSGVFVLAALLGCPVVLAFGLHHSPNRYHFYCEPFADEVEVPRGQRDEALREHAQRYADRLEHYCRLAPDNWFNFFDFWVGDRDPP